MSCFDREKGMALLVVLAIIVITSGLAVTVLYFITKQTEVSGLQKRYQTAKEASLGAVEVFTKEVIPATISGTTLSAKVTGFSTISTASVTVALPSTCDFSSDKLKKSTANWSSNCSTAPVSAPVGSTPADADLKFTLKSASGQPFDVYAKIVDTVAGNSSTGGVSLEGGGGSGDAGSGVISTQHFPYMYTIEVLGQRQQNPSERAYFEVLYAY
ncbi:MAG: hypothetical protein NTX75_05105 [Proteobacteria bacterium]|nr:hypothetical protein [Pseudomonadota bacterium]